MRLTPRHAEGLLERLRAAGLISPGDQTLAELATGGADLGAWLVFWTQSRLLRTDQWGPLLAAELGWPWVTALDQEALDLPQPAVAWTHREAVCPWCRRDGRLWLALADPGQLAAGKALASLCGEPVAWALTDAASLAAATVAIPQSMAEPVTTGQAALLEALLTVATDQRASDVHLEPAGAGLQVRYRVDGHLRPGPPIAAHLAEQLLNHVKIRAGVASTERRRPQDGRFSILGRQWRVACLPCQGGESVALRLLDHTEAPQRLDALGLPEPVRSAIRPMLTAQEGLLLITGPTGSGKTTTLYALARHLLELGRHLATVEDPIEMSLPGVPQVAVRPQQGLTFAHALRALLRQAPDALLVGEIRDAETAGVALEAALTGHLVLSSLHTTHAVGAIARLRDLGIANYRLAAAIRGILAQRLSPRPCGHCGPIPQPSCPHCHGTGHCGRRGIYEWLAMEPEFAAAVHAGADESTLEAIWRRHGGCDLATHAQELAAAGEIVTTTPALP